MTAKNGQQIRFPYRNRQGNSAHPRRRARLGLEQLEERTLLTSGPTGLTINESVIPEKSGPNALVGTLTTLDTSPGVTFNYSLISGPGGGDNSLFALNGNQLLEINSLNSSTKPTCSVLIQSTDSNGQSIEKSFTITVLPSLESTNLDLVSSVPAALWSDTGAAQSNAAALSNDGSYLAFVSAAGNLVPGINNGFVQVYVRNLATGQITCVSTDGSGNPGNGDSSTPVLSSDGNYIAFASAATNLVPGDNNNTIDVFVENLRTEQIALVNTSAAGVQANAISAGPAISADGRYVAFESEASNLMPNGTNAGIVNVYVKDTQTGNLALASISAQGKQADQGSYNPSLSSDGSIVAFESDADNLVQGDNNGSSDVFVKFLQTGKILRASTSANGLQGNSDSYHGALSGNGAYVAFESDASNLTPGDNNSSTDVFVKNLQTGAIVMASTDANGNQGNKPSYGPELSNDGSLVVFVSQANNLVPDDTNKAIDVYVKNWQTGQITLASANATGTQGNGASYLPSFSGDGGLVAFESVATNLVPNDTNDATDIFVKSLLTGTVSLGSSHDPSLPERASSGSSTPFALSNDGTLAVFASTADDLVPGVTSSFSNVFVKNLTTGQVSLVSTDANGNLANADCTNPVISGNGTFVAFVSAATNLVPNNLADLVNVYVKNLATGAITLAGMLPDGTFPNNNSSAPVLSNDGSLVAFVSSATNLVPADTSKNSDVFVENLITGIIKRVSTSAAGAQGNGPSLSPVLAGDGNFIAFVSSATDLVPGDAGNISQIFVRNLQNGQIMLASASAGGAPANAGSSSPSLSSDGRYLAFVSTATNLVPGDTSGTGQVFVKDLQTGQITVASADGAGNLPNDDSSSPVISADGVFVAFASQASNLVAATAYSGAIYLKDLQTGGIIVVSTGEAGVTANAVAGSPAVSADAGTVVFDSSATNEVPLEFNTNGNVYAVLLAAAPSAVQISNNIAVEQQPVGTLIGILTTPGMGIGSTATYSLVNGTGGIDNASFVIVGNQLETNQIFSYQTKNQYSILVRATDALGRSIDQTLAISIDSLPVAANASYTVNENTTLKVAAPGLLTGATDADGNNLTAVLSTGPNHGLVSVNANGSFTYTPGPAFYGTDSFTYQVTDGLAVSSAATVSITVNPVNTPPTAEPATVTLGASAEAQVVLTGSDLESPPSNLTFTITSLPAKGILLNSVGKVVTKGSTFTGSPADLTYEGTFLFGNTSDSFTFTVSDVGADAGIPGDNLTSTPATVTVNTPAGSAGIAFFGGTEGNDAIVVSSTSGGQLQYLLNGKVITSSVALSTVTSLQIFGRGGNDAVQVTGLDLPMSFDGGAGTNTIVIHGTAGNATWVLGPKLSTTVGLALNLQNTAVTLIGGGGVDTLVGPDLANTWTVTAANQGTLNANLTFIGFQNLVGGSAADTFKLNADKGISGKIDGGPGNNTLDESAYTTVVAIDLATSAATGIASFANVQNFLAGSATSNSIIGPNQVSVWNITGTNAVNLGGIAFAGFQNLTGGSANDTFRFANGAGVTGIIDGGAGANGLDYSAYATPVTVNLQSGSVTGLAIFKHLQTVVGGLSGADSILGPNRNTVWSITAANAGSVAGLKFSGIANLTGGTGSDTFVFANGASVSGQVNGGAGANALDYSAYTTGVMVNVQTLTATGTAGFEGIQSFKGGSSPANQLIGANGASTWNLTGTNAGNVNGLNFSGFPNVTGGTAADTFNVTTFGKLTGVLSGGGGADLLVGPNVAKTWQITGNNAGTLVNSLQFTGIASIKGGLTTDVFQMAVGGSLSGTLDGGGGNNTLLGAGQVNTWDITVNNGGTLNGSLAFSHIQYLVGGTAADTFVPGNGVSLSGRIDGGGGNNTLDLSAYTTAVTVNLQSKTATAIGGFVNLQNLLGGISTANTIIGPNLANTWQITGLNMGTVAGYSFQAFANLTGGHLNDTFAFARSSSVSGQIDGGTGINRLDYSAYTTPVTLNLQAQSVTGTGGITRIDGITGGSSVGDIIIGPNAGATWLVTGVNTGVVNGFAFTGIKNLQGGQGTDHFIFLNGESVTGKIDGGGGNNTLDYSAYTTAVSVNFQTLAATATARMNHITTVIGGKSNANQLIAANTPNKWQIAGVNSGLLNTIPFSRFQNLVGGTGTDTFVVSLGGKLTGGLTGGGGADTLQGPNAALTWYLTGANSGMLGSLLQFSSISNLSGGSGPDVFQLSPGGSLSGTLNGGTGANTLDYSKFTPGVSVNLTTGVATGIGGLVSNIHIVFGSTGNDELTGSKGNDTLVGDGGNDTISGGASGNDVLVGGSGNDVLTAGSGRTLMIGGKGSDTMVGGAGDDLLIGGTTTYGANLAALSAIMSEWTNSTETYQQRIDHLRGTTPGGANGAYLLDSSTVQTVGSKDILTGNGGLNWFWANASDTITDLTKGEQID